jgi:hypothetical protein
MGDQACRMNRLSALISPAADFPLWSKRRNSVVTEQYNVGALAF